MPTATSSNPTLNFHKQKAYTRVDIGFLWRRMRESRGFAPLHLLLSSATKICKQILLETHRPQQPKKHTNLVCFMVAECFKPNPNNLKFVNYNKVFSINANLRNILARSSFGKNNFPMVIYRIGAIYRAPVALMNPMP